MAGVKEDRLHEIMRAWLRSHVEAAGGQRELARKTGIKHPQISVALDGGYVSWRMLALISEMEGMSMQRVFDQIGGRIAAAESGTETMMTPFGAAKPGDVVTLPGGVKVRLVQPGLPASADEGRTARGAESDVETDRPRGRRHDTPRRQH